MMKNQAETYFRRSHWLIGGLIALVTLMLDQLTKWLALTYQFGQAPTEIIPGLLRFTYTTNPGAAWGILAGHTLLLGFVSLIVMLIMVWRFPVMTEGLPERVASLGLMIGGIAGNLIDRFARREVIDFIDLHFRGRHWPTFNIADSAICVGITVYLISVAIRKTGQPNEN